MPTELSVGREYNPDKWIFKVMPCENYDFNVILVKANVRRLEMKDKVIEILSKVFVYGDATNTHLNILNLLHDAGVGKEIYSTWNKDAVITNAMHQNGEGQGVKTMGDILRESMVMTKNNYT